MLVRSSSLFPATMLLLVAVGCHSDEVSAPTPSQPFSPISLAGGTDTTVASRDTYIRRGSQNSNYGLTDSLRVRSAVGNSDTTRGLVGFDQGTLSQRSRVAPFYRLPCV